MSKSVPIGLTNLVYAKLISDTPPTTPTSNDGATLYEAPIRISGAITANFSPNASNDTLFADDGPYETASTLGAMSLELNVADIPAPQRADLLGATYDSTTGVLIHGSDDVPPYVAVGMSVKKSNGADRYIWYLKGKFTAPDDNNQTKADSINWNTPTITGNFLKRDADDRYRTSLDTDDTNVPTAIKNAWFDDPNVDLGETVAELVVTPLSGTLSKAAVTEVTVTVPSAPTSVEWKYSGEAAWKPLSAPGEIDTTDWVAGTTVVVNLRASEPGKNTRIQNLVYTVTA